YGRLYERVDELGDADYHADRGLFFRSIHGSLNHLLLVDRLWLQRLEGQVTGKVNLAEELEPERRALRDAIFAECERFIGYVDSLEESAFDEMHDYVSSTGEAFTRPRASLIAHVVNHGTHHRGQVSAALTQCGLDAPVMDIPYFL